METAAPTHTVHLHNGTAVTVTLPEGSTSAEVYALTGDVDVYLRLDRDRLIWWASAMAVANLGTAEDEQQIDTDVYDHDIPAGRITVSPTEGDHARMVFDNSAGTAIEDYACADELTVLVDVCSAIAAQL